MPRDSRDNISIRIDGTKLVIEIETDPAEVDSALSASGKSRVFATTGGALPIREIDMALNLTLYQKVRR